MSMRTSCGPVARRSMSIASSGCLALCAPKAFVIMGRGRWEEEARAACRGRRPSRWEDSRMTNRVRASVVAHLREEPTPSLGGHVEQSPQRIDRVAGAMVLVRFARGEAHL